MEKLELRHIAPYLPYKLRAFDVVSDRSKVVNIGLGSSTNWVSAKTFLRYSDVYKPILRPLSDLTKEIEHNGEKFVPKDRMANYGYDLDDFEICHVAHTSYTVLMHLIEWHFDVFGLIEKNLAINFNTLQNGK